jgi:regulator of sirC expression with transglutaminase-like and TPR domain
VNVAHGGFKRIAVAIAFGSGLLLLGTTQASAAAPKQSLRRHACGFPASLIGEKNVGRCDELDPLRAKAAEAIAGAQSPPVIIDRLNHFFFDKEQFQVTYDLSSAAHLLPEPVLAGRKGYCVGLAAIYLMLAEELDLPIHGVATPKHLFLRWDDGKFRQNIELFQKGRVISDEDYIREQRIPKESLEQGVFLANLTGREFLGFLYQNTGVLESQRGAFDSSKEYYFWALARNPRLAAAYYNRGNDELKQKRYRKAIRDYTKSLELYPGDPWAMKNRELARKGLEEKGKRNTVGGKQEGL